MNIDMSQGWVILPRFLMELPPKPRQLYIQILLLITHKRHEVRNGITLEPGQCLVTHGFLAEQMGWTIRQIRYSLGYLFKQHLLQQVWQINASKLSIKMSDKLSDKNQIPKRFGMLLTVCNYNEIQSMLQQTKAKSRKKLSDELSIPSVKNSEKVVNYTKRIVHNEDIQKDINIADESISEHKKFITFAADSYEKRFSQKLLIAGGKDGTAVKRLLNSYSLDDLQNWWLQYLADDDEFINRTGRTLAKFATVLTRYLEQKSKPMTPKNWKGMVK